MAQFQNLKAECNPIGFVHLKGMRKVLNAAQIRELDAYTIENEPISSVDLMERAAQSCVDQLFLDFPDTRRWIIWCGTGNNGGDGLAMARMLSPMAESVQVIVCGEPENGSADFKINFHRLADSKVALVDLEDLSTKDLTEKVYIDCLFGSGLNRPVSGIASNYIECINKHEQVVSIDLPSGLPADPRSFELNPSTQHIVKAQRTYTFDSYKFTLLLDDLASFYGKVRVLEIGLNKTFRSSLESNTYFWSLEECRALRSPRSAYLHKGRTGHALLAVGQAGMMGAAVLASKACLRSGVGLVSVHSAKSHSDVLQIVAPEAICRPSQNADRIDLHFTDLERYAAIGIGCGIGVHPDVVDALSRFLSVHYHGDQALVLDADALNILSQNSQLWEHLIDRPVVLTPHPREFDRLFGTHMDHSARVLSLSKKSVELKVHIVLKGATTWIGCPDGELHAFPYPNDGLAKGGSGDVLTGILTSFLAQGYAVREAICLSIGLQAYAARECALEMTTICMLPGDLIRYFPRFFSA